MEQLCSHWTDFHEILHLSIFRKSVQKIQPSLKSDKNNGYFILWPIHILIISRSILLRLKCVSYKTCRENQNTHFVLKFFFPKIVPFTRWSPKNTAQPDMQQITIRRMRFATWIPKATDTNSQYVIFMAFPPQQWLRERASLLRYTYIASLSVL